MSSSSSSFFRSDAQRFEIYIDVPPERGRLDLQMEEQFTQRLRELLPAPRAPDEVCFRGHTVYINYSSRSRADDALTTLHRVVSFDSTSPVDLALRTAVPAGRTINKATARHALFFFNVERLSMEVVRAAFKRLLGSDNLLLPIDVRNAPTAKGDNVFVDFHSRDALERALRICGDISADSNDAAERAVHGVEISNNTLAAYAGASMRERGVIVAGAASEQPRSRIFRCELCRDELDVRDFPSSELERHRDAPRCRSCCERREAEKRRREWEQERRREESAPAPAGGGAAATAASSTGLHPCPAQSPTGRCTLPSPCRFAVVRSDRCVMWLLGMCGQSGDHDGLTHSLTPMEQQTIAALQQVQQQQQQPPPHLQPIFQPPAQQQQQYGAQLHNGSGNHQQQAHGYNQVAQVPPAAPAPPHVLPPGPQQRFLANYQQAQQQQPPQQQQHERAGRRREREDFGDDGFAARRHGRY